MSLDTSFCEQYGCKVGSVGAASGTVNSIVDATLLLL